MKFRIGNGQNIRQNLINETMRLIVNAGSATLKLASFESERRQKSKVYEIKTSTAYASALSDFLKGKTPSVIVHRMVHGGDFFRKSIKISSSVLKKLRKIEKLAPPHNPIARKCIERCIKMFPIVLQFLVFDTEFHKSIPELHFRYPIPDRSFRRFGFHGIVCASLVRQLKKMKKLSHRTIICHLGSGCSVTAVKDGKSIDTTMGFTPLEGLVMGTRAGDLDPGLVMVLVEKYGNKKLFEILSRNSGLKALTGTDDMRTILRRSGKGDRRSQLAIEIFCSKAAKGIAALTTSLGGLDTLVFSGGIGENAPLIRAKICDELKPLGVKIHLKKNLNAKAGLYFHKLFSSAKLLLLHADEADEMNRILL